MKKTLTANISGTVFHIEEDAYEALNRYLDSIRSRFAATAGRDEIMADIEARIAELFTERLDGRRQVVHMADVEQVIAIMGRPEDFADGEPVGTAGGGAGTSSTAAGDGRRRLYRDTEDKWVGGVLGGLGAYIGMDPLWLRIAMIALVLASVGSVIPIYILLWILVPKAETAADRLQMRGEPVTVENIKRIVEEGAEKLKQGGERFAHEASTLGRTWGQQTDRRRSQAINVITKLMGVGLIAVALSMLLGLVTGIIGGTVSLWNATWSNEELSIMDLGELVFNNRQHALWMTIGLFTVLVVPIIGLFLSGFRLLLGTCTPRWLGLSLLVLWLAAWVPVVYTSVALGMDFKRRNSTLTEIELVQPADGVLHLDALPPDGSTGNWSFRYDGGELNVDLDGLHLEDGMVHGGWARIDVERSTDTLFHLKLEREAHGVTSKAALQRAGRIGFRFQQLGHVLRVSPVIEFPAADKLRGQDADFTLEVPAGKSIHLLPGSKHVIHDIHNVTNTYDEDMVGRTWTMTSKGLMDLNTHPNGSSPTQQVPQDTIRTAPTPVALHRTSAAPGQQTATPERPRHQASLVPNLFGLIFLRLL